MESEAFILVATSDTHAGGETAIMPGPVELPRGATYSPGPLQTQLFQWHTEAWDQIEAERDRLRARGYESVEIGVLHNGDLVEGDHHDTAELVSRHPGIEHQIARDVLDDIAARGIDHWWFTHGTESHTGKAGSREEGVVKAFREGGHNVHSHPDTGKPVAFQWDVEVMGWRFQATHHGNIGRTPRTKGSLIALRAADLWMDHQLNDWRRWEQGQQDDINPHHFPHIGIGSHFHQFAVSAWGMFPTQLVQLPCWTFKGMHAWKVAARSETDFGLVYWIIEPDRDPQMKPFIRKPRRAGVCRI